MSQKTDASKAASVLGRRSYQARLERLGLERLQEIARENGKKGGRPKANETAKKIAKRKTAAKKGGK